MCCLLHWKKKRGFSVHYIESPSHIKHSPDHKREEALKKNVLEYGLYSVMSILFTPSARYQEKENRVSQKSVHHIVWRWRVRILTIQESTICHALSVGSIAYSLSLVDHCELMHAVRHG